MQLWPIDPPPEAAMRSFPRLGSVNAALVAIYFAPVWGGDGLRALISPFHGFEDRVHAVAAGYFRALFDLGLTGLVHTSNVLAGIKFVIAIGFLAYLIDFARAVVVGRDTNRETLDAVLLLAAVALMFWAWPALGSGDAALIRLHATQFLLLSSAMIVLVVERHIEEAKAPYSTIAPLVRADTTATAARPQLLSA
jgi:hypothetical protein